MSDLFQLACGAIALACLVFLLRPVFRWAWLLVRCIVAAWRDWGEVDEMERRERGER